MEGAPNPLRKVSPGDLCNWCNKPISEEDARKSIPGFPYHVACRGSNALRRSR